MDQRSPKVQAFRQELTENPWIGAMWKTYHATHKWAQGWPDVTEEQLDEAFAWIERMKGECQALLAELQKSLNLPEEE